MTLKNELLAVEEMAKEEKAIRTRLEPLGFASDKAKLRAEYALSPTMLAWRDSFRTFEWERVIPSPKGTLIQMGQLLAIPAVF